jgi:hypothetical protein
MLHESMMSRGPTNEVNMYGMKLGIAGKRAA